MTRKLKPDRGIQGLVPAIFSVVLFFCTLVIFGYQAAFNTLGIIILVYSLVFGFWPFARTGNAYILVSAFYLVFFGLVLLQVDIKGDINNPMANPGNELKLSMIFVYLFLIWLIYLVALKKLKWRGREIMELAAWDVEEALDTYTERPRPAGVVDYSKYDIIDFGNYLKRNLVCMSYQEENRVVLLPIKMSNEFAMLYQPNFDYLSKTWISFGFDGNVSVHISRKDYLDYRDDLSFDHLCESLGKLMITFAEFYMKGDKVRIMDRLNSVKLGYFS
ncbi:MAG TPA: hypothetical protein DCR40_06960 [Prolixibacteraceae bacterium]|nr:hypothetical protein [Prolixibacteraceae bacterium]